LFTVSFLLLFLQGVEIFSEEHRVVIQPYYMEDVIIVDDMKVDLTYGKPIVFLKKIAYQK
jgi:hypothetical protein